MSTTRSRYEFRNFFGNGRHQLNTQGWHMSLFPSFSKLSFFWPWIFRYIDSMKEMQISRQIAAIFVIFKVSHSHICINQSQKLETSWIVTVTEGNNFFGELCARTERKCHFSTMTVSKNDALWFWITKTNIYKTEIFT